MPENTQELELLRKELADVSSFVKERVEPAQEERIRLRKAIEALTHEQQEYRRASVLGGDAEDAAERVVKSGPYTGCDVLDLAIMRSMQRATGSRLGSGSVRDWEVRIKAAMDSITAGKGDELVPSGMSSRLWNDVHQKTHVASLFNRIEMPTDPFDVPLQLGDVNWYPGVENTAVSGSVASTSKQTLTAYELVAEVPWSLTLDEDAVFAVLPEVRRTLVRNAAEVIDDVLLNADVTRRNNINADGSVLTPSTAGKAHLLVGFDGLLHLPLVDNPSQSKSVDGEISALVYLDLLKSLGKYGITATESAFVTDISTFISSMSLAPVETLDKLGPLATILTGQLGMVYGHPLIVSSQMLPSDADGKVTGGGNDVERGRLLAVNTTQWRLGFRRNLMIETERDIQKRQNVMVVSMRLAFAERSGDRSSAQHTALAFNITN